MSENKNKDYKINSCLIIINNNLDDELCKSLFRLKYIKTIDIPQEKKDKTKYLKKRIKIKY